MPEYAGQPESAANDSDNNNESEPGQPGEKTPHVDSTFGRPEKVDTVAEAIYLNDNRYYR